MRLGGSSSPKEAQGMRVFPGLHGNVTTPSGRYIMIKGGVQLKTINPLIGPRPVGRASPNRRPIRGDKKIKNIWRCYQSGLLVRAQLVFYTKCVCG